MNMLVTATTVLALAAGAVFAAEPTEKDAIAMADRGAALIKAKGKAEMMKRITAKDPDFVQGSLYVDMRDLYTGIVLAHPINQSIVGKDLTDVPDANGKPYRREIINLAQKKRQGLGRLPVQEPGERQDRTEDHLHPAGGRRGAGSGHLQKIGGTASPAACPRNCRE